MALCPAAYDETVVSWLINIGQLTPAQQNQSKKKLAEDVGQIYTDIMVHLARNNYRL